MPNADSTSLIELFNPGALPWALAIVIITIVAVRLIDNLSQRVAERFMTHRLRIKKINTVIAFSAYVIATVVALGSLFKLSSEALDDLFGYDYYLRYVDDIFERVGLS